MNVEGHVLAVLIGCWSFFSRVSRHNVVFSVVVSSLEGFSSQFCFHLYFSPNFFLPVSAASNISTSLADAAVDAVGEAAVKEGTPEEPPTAKAAGAPSTSTAPTPGEREERAAAEEAKNRPNIDWQEKIQRGILRGL